MSGWVDLSEFVVRGTPSADDPPRGLCLAGQIELRGQVQSDDYAVIRLPEKLEPGRPLPPTRRDTFGRKVSFYEDVDGVHVRVEMRRTP